MVRLVDESGAPCALHLAVRDATGKPILELRADSPERWDFGAVTVLHTQREELRSLIERVMQEVHRRSTVPIEVTFEGLVPGAAWSEVARVPLSA